MNRYWKAYLIHMRTINIDVATITFLRFSCTNKENFHICNDCFRAGFVWCEHSLLQIVRAVLCLLSFKEFFGPFLLLYETEMLICHVRIFLLSPQGTKANILPCKFWARNFCFVENAWSQWWTHALSSAYSKGCRFCQLQYHSRT